MEPAVPSFIFTPGRNIQERTASGPLDIGRRILRSLLITAPQDWERRLRRIHVGIFHTPDCSPQSLTALMPNPHDKAPRNCSLPEAVPLDASGNTTGRMARLQKPYGRQMAKPFNSHPVPISCAIQAHQDVRYGWSIHRG